MIGTNREYIKQNTVTKTIKENKRNAKKQKCDYNWC